ncbi:MAG TPA: glycosyltransferase, partial [candidate division WWE3 bacterium]|nr:glycosyltransferase [candidate division WWE3 bacterium]
DGNGNGENGNGNGNGNGRKLVSIVIPCYNEEKNIDRTIEGLLNIARKSQYNYEIIAVNDGSKDKTWEVIKTYADKYPSVKGINQMTNFGQSAAYQAGFDLSQGDYVITVSADLEIPLDNVEVVLRKLEEGYDFVNTHRVGRWQNDEDATNAGRSQKSGMANKIIGAISKVHMEDRGSGMKGFTKIIVKNLRLYGEMHRFIPDCASVYGARMMEFEVQFSDRDFGVSAYKGNKRTIKVMLDLMTLGFMLYFAKKPFYALPGRLFGATGAVISGIGFAIGGYLGFLKVFMGQSIGYRPLLSVAILMIIVGIQSMMMGVLGELLMRIYFEATGRKTYTVREVRE